MDGDSQIDKIIGVVIAALIGLILIVRAFLPIAADQIAGISNIQNINAIFGEGSAGTITGLMSVVVTIVIIALVVSVIKMLRDRD